MTDWTSYTDEELLLTRDEIDAEINRRAQVAFIPPQMVAMNAEYLALSGVVTGEPWVQPTGAHDAYPLDWVVTHDDKTWTSLVASNVWEPGVANWREDSGEEWPAWVQPTGATDAYPAGAQVTHAEKHWISLVNANVWEPGTVGTESLWSEETAV